MCNNKEAFRFSINREFNLKAKDYERDASTESATRQSEIIQQNQITQRSPQRSQSISETFVQPMEARSETLLKNEISTLNEEKENELVQTKDPGLSSGLKESPQIEKAKESEASESSDSDKNKVKVNKNINNIAQSKKMVKKNDFTSLRKQAILHNQDKNQNLEIKPQLIEEDSSNRSMSLDENSGLNSIQDVVKNLNLHEKNKKTSKLAKNSKGSLPKNNPPGNQANL